MVDPPAAGLHFAGVRLRVDAALAARLELEVLDRIGDVGLQPVDAGLVDRGFSVHVNIAARQLAEGSFVERVLAAVHQMELSPHQLTLDIDEDTLNDRQAGTLRSLQALRRFGVRLALDSFGTGVSSLTALRTCEADVLKLCLLYTSDAADERSSVDLGGRRIIKKKIKQKSTVTALININNECKVESI